MTVDGASSLGSPFIRSFLPFIILIQLSSSGIKERFYSLVSFDEPDIFILNKREHLFFWGTRRAVYPTDIGISSDATSVSFSHYTHS